MQIKTSMKMSGDMFDDKDYPTQWALNPAAYQNMSNDQGNIEILIMSYSIAIKRIIYFLIY